MKGKNVLLISPYFFGYEQNIKEEIEKRGSKVYLFNDSLSQTFMTKVFIRLNSRVIRKKIDKYYQKMVCEIQNKDSIDYILVIKGESINESSFAILKKAFPNAKTLLYLYDSMNNLKFSTRKLDKFDKVFSFDSNDVEEYGFSFLPLFYIDEYDRNYNESKIKTNYRICTIATSHSDRPFVVNRIKEQLDCKEVPYKFILYTQNRLFHVLRYLKKDYRLLCKAGMVTLNKLTSEEIGKIVEQSDCVLDIQHKMQSGLTMRTFEVLAMNKKIITTNKEIKKYDFYTDSNCCIIDRDNPLIDDLFLDSKYQSIEVTIKDKYSLNNWINNLFDVIK